VNELAEDRDPALLITNEFACVRVRKVHTRNGERLEILSLGRERSIVLDALALESLTWSTVLDVGRGLEQPFGPEQDLEPQTSVSSSKSFRQEAKEA
jgi:hypothetical protein